MKFKLSKNDVKSLKGSMDSFENPTLKNAVVDVVNNNAIAGFAKVVVEYVQATFVQA